MAHTRELLTWVKKTDFMQVFKILCGNKSDKNKRNVIDVIFVLFIKGKHRNWAKYIGY
jgi:hypothetical protein